MRQVFLKKQNKSYFHLSFEERYNIVEHFDSNHNLPSSSFKTDYKTNHFLLIQALCFRLPKQVIHLLNSHKSVNCIDKGDSLLEFSTKPASVRPTASVRPAASLILQRCLSLPILIKHSFNKNKVIPLKWFFKLPWQHHC